MKIYDMLISKDNYMKFMANQLDNLKAYNVFAVEDLTQQQTFGLIQTLTNYSVRHGKTFALLLPDDLEMRFAKRGITHFGKIYSRTAI